MFKKKPDSIRQGQIYLVDLPEIAGSIQRGQRPMIITLSDSRNHAASVVNASVVTSKIKRLDLPYHIRDPLYRVRCETRGTQDLAKPQGHPHDPGYLHGCLRQSS